MDTQILRNQGSLLPESKAFGRRHPQALAHLPPLRGQTTALWVSHDNGIPQN
jgi:hypothetical protein